MDDDPITPFTGEYAFLSNLFPHAIAVNGDIYPTNEHAFQALKTDDPAEREKVRQTKTPASAKSLGKRVTLREGWDTLRFEVMERLVRAKFADPDLAAKLLATGRRELIEGNTWRDTTWGCVRGKDGNWKGRNELGKILMEVRSELGGWSITAHMNPNTPHRTQEPTFRDTAANRAAALIRENGGWGSRQRILSLHGQKAIDELTEAAYVLDENYIKLPPLTEIDEAARGESATGQ